MNQKGSQKLMMKLITVHLPNNQVSGLDELVRSGRYPNRSEAIRFAIRDMLKDELWSLNASSLVPQPRNVY
jgi:Arc/MetJ-type ribon-helix-helix transcriptional regulator